MVWRGKRGRSGLPREEPGFMGLGSPLGSDRAWGVWDCNSFMKEDSSGALEDDLLLVPDLPPILIFHGMDLPNRGIYERQHQQQHSRVTYSERG